MMRYIKMLENKDLSLNTSMISLGCLHHEAECSHRNDPAQLGALEQDTSLRPAWRRWQVTNRSSIELGEYL